MMKNEEIVFQNSQDLRGNLDEFSRRHPEYKNKVFLNWAKNGVLVPEDLCKFFSKQSRCGGNCKSDCPLTECDKCPAQRICQAQPETRDGEWCKYVTAYVPGGRA